MERIVTVDPTGTSIGSSRRHAIWPVTNPASLPATPTSDPMTGAEWQMSVFSLSVCPGFFSQI
jgi:hypothetical protein